MADYQTLQAYVSTNIVKRIENQPEIKELSLSMSKTVGILVKEALDARELKHNPIKREKTHK